MGIGVERGVFRAAFEQVIQMHTFWGPRSSYYSPQFLRHTEPVPSRIHMWKTFGTMIALHMFYFGQAPADISPFLILALAGGRSAMNLSASYIEYFDPEVAKSLSPWLSLAHTDPMPTDPAHPLSLLILNYLETQVCYFPPTPASRSMFSVLLLLKPGMPDIHHS